MPLVGATNYAVVTVDEVDIVNRLFHAKDKTNSSFQVSFRESAGGFLQVPLLGEKWLIELIGKQWHITGRLDSLEDHQWMVDNMNPGDARIQANKLVIKASEIEIIGTEIVPIDSGRQVGVINSGSIEFSFTFPSIPHVVVSPEDATTDISQNGGSGAPADFIVAAHNFSTTGFSFSGSWSGTRNFQWIAHSHS